MKCSSTFIIICFIIQCQLILNLTGINPACECIIFKKLLNKEETIFKSPNHPDIYPPSINCILYTFIGSPEDIIELEFIEFDTQMPTSSRCNDFLRFYLDLPSPHIDEKKNWNYELCGNITMLNTRYHYSSTSQLILEFHSDIQQTMNSGFKGKFKFLKKDLFKPTGSTDNSKYFKDNQKNAQTRTCTFHFHSSYESEAGQFFSPKYPQNYPANAHCKYYFHGKKDERVLIELHKIDLDVFEGSCSVNPDYIAIWEGFDLSYNSDEYNNDISLIRNVINSSTSEPQSSNSLSKINFQNFKSYINKSSASIIRRFCNKLSSQKILSTGPALLVEFVSDSREERQGFAAEYKFMKSFASIDHLNRLETLMMNNLYVNNDIPDRKYFTSNVFLLHKNPNFKINTSNSKEKLDLINDEYYVKTTKSTKADSYIARNHFTNNSNHYLTSYINKTTRFVKNKSFPLDAMKLNRNNSTYDVEVGKNKYSESHDFSPNKLGKKNSNAIYHNSIRNSNDYYHESNQVNRGNNFDVFSIQLDKEAYFKNLENAHTSDEVTSKKHYFDRNFNKHKYNIEGVYNFNRRVESANYINDSLNRKLISFSKISLLNATPDCSHNYLSTESRNGIITSPGYPETYSLDIKCRYSFQGLEHERIQITFEDFDLHSPEDKFQGEHLDCDELDNVQVKVRIGFSMEDLATYCKKNSKTMIMSPESKLDVWFISNRVDQGLFKSERGFKATYKFVTNFGISSGKQRASNGCEFVYRSEEHMNGSFTTPNYPGLYPRNTECHYLFHGKKPEIITIHFVHFDVDGLPPDCSTNTQSDYVEFSNFNVNLQDRKMSRYCGNDIEKTRPIVSDTFFFRVTFKSNHLHDASGFIALYNFKKLEDPSLSRTADSEGVILKTGSTSILIFICIINLSSLLNALSLHFYYSEHLITTL